MPKAILLPIFPITWLATTAAGEVQALSIVHPKSLQKNLSRAAVQRISRRALSLGRPPRQLQCRALSGVILLGTRVDPTKIDWQAEIPFGQQSPWRCDEMLPSKGQQILHFCFIEVAFAIIR